MCKPSSLSSFDYVRFTARPCGISTEFIWAITTQFCFTYTLYSVTAMSRGPYTLGSATHFYLILIINVKNLTV